MNVTAAESIPTTAPTPAPSSMPTHAPTPTPTDAPTPVPTIEPTKSPTQAGCLDKVPGANHPQCELFKTNQIYCQNVATANCIWVQGPTMAPTPLPNDHV